MKSYKKLITIANQMNKTIFQEEKEHYIYNKNHKNVILNKTFFKIRKDKNNLNDFLLIFLFFNIRKFYKIFILIIISIILSYIIILCTQRVSLLLFILF